MSQSFCGVVPSAQTLSRCPVQHGLSPLLTGRHLPMICHGYLTVSTSCCRAS